MPPSLPTTLIEQSKSTLHASSIRKPMQVRWVFPHTEVTAIANGHRLGRCAGCDECGVPTTSSGVPRPDQKQSSDLPNRTVLAGSVISRHHARLEVDDPLVVIHDLNSINHLFINGKPTTKAPLRLGDVIRCGEWVGVVVADSDPLGFRSIAEDWYGGASLAAVVEPLKHLARDIPIIVQGETGTGKEGVARAVHAWSRCSGQFVGFNCAAIPEGLAESELFGCVKGSHHLAVRDNPGLFRAADRGTVLLDEIMDLPLPIQTKLLRAIELREVLPLGTVSPARIDVRVVVATQESLATAAEQRRIRMDLFGRLDGYTVQLPALRERREDIVPLFVQLWHDRTEGHRPTFDGKFAELLSTYDWPMNVRELLLLVRRLVSIHGSDATLKRGYLPERMLARVRSEFGESELPPAEPAKRAWRKLDDEAEFDALAEALRENSGNVSRAAKAIGLDRNRANRLLAAHTEFSVQDLRSDA